MFAAIVGQSWATAAHPYNLEINGIDWINSASFPTIDIELAGPGSNGSMRFTLSDPTSAIDVSEWDEVRFLENAATRPILFGGFVQSVRSVPWAAVGRYLVVECMGYGVLLDRKVVDVFTTDAQEYVAPNLISLVNRFGGRVSCTANGFQTSRNAYTTDPQDTVAYAHDWWWTAAPADQPSITAATMLRAVIDSWSASSSDLAIDPGLTMTVLPSTGMIYWVDSAALFHAHPQLDENFGAANIVYDGDAAIAISDTAGAGLVSATILDFERENTDLLTSAYVVGGNGAGTGFVYRTGLERAGDLQTIVNQPLSTSANRKQTFGDGAIATTQASSVRASVTFNSSTPVDIRPGQRLLFTNAALGFSSEPFRVTAVSISFQSSTSRDYAVSFGGQLPLPSASRRSGRFRTLR